MRSYELLFEQIDIRNNDLAVQNLAQGRTQAAVVPSALAPRYSSAVTNEKLIVTRVPNNPQVVILSKDPEIGQRLAKIPNSISYDQSLPGKNIFPQSRYNVAAADKALGVNDISKTWELIRQTFKLDNLMPQQIPDFIEKEINSKPNPSSQFGYRPEPPKSPSVAGTAPPAQQVSPIRSAGSASSIGGAYGGPGPKFPLPGKVM